LEKITDIKNVKKTQIGEEIMEKVCTGCRKTNPLKDDMRNSNPNRICTCKDREEQIHIDPRLDQTAADSHEENKACATDHRTEGRPNSHDLKSKIFQDLKDLPPMPQVVIRIQHLIADLNSDTKQLAKVIESDQAIAAKVLKMANSAFYGMSGKISSIHQASLLLGYRTLGEIATMAGAADLLARKMPGYGYDSQDLWKHSLSVAFSCKLIADLKNKDLIHEAHTAGLIHDVGKIILDRHVLGKKDKIADYMVQEEKTFLDAERFFFGFDHAEIASEICRSWKIPEGIALAIRYHHQPSISNGDGLSCMLHIADYVATMGGIGYDNDDILYQAERGAMDFIGLTQEDIGNMIPKVIEAVEQL
jgi:putative nucleotidyltransferase with HDIG domain